jgi:hypothetical protein
VGVGNFGRHDLYPQIDESTQLSDCESFDRFHP